MVDRELQAIAQKHDGLSRWNILHVYRGSIAHDMYIPDTDPDSIDDVDTMAICIPSKPYYLALKQYGSRGTREIKYGKWDIVVYELRKAIQMLAKANPNILSMLWVDEKHHINVSPAGQMLLDNRDLFATRRAFKAYEGYSYGQLKRMTAFKFEGYMGQKRKELVERYGYDTKNAAHLIRLLRMGIEFLDTGTMSVARPDAAELLEIKRGGWPLEKVNVKAKALFAMLRIAENRSPLPSEPDYDKINQLCIEMVEAQWG